MPIQEIINIRETGSREQKLSMSMAIHCAPILKGSKLANIMTVSGRELALTEFMLRETEISCCFFGTEREKGILYLYREKELRAYLNSDRVREFLAQYGYRGGSMEELLQRLAGRIARYGGQNSFPHEIGIFLGYPLEDVKGFIENEGKNFRHLGYWKVYHDVQGAVRLFRQFDEEREQAVGEIILGKSIGEIAVRTA